MVQTTVRATTKTVILGALLLLGLHGPAEAKMPCPEVLAGVEKAGKGKTPEEVATELGIPPRRVRACLRKNGAKDEEGNPVKGLRRAKREAEAGKDEEESGAAKAAAGEKAEKKATAPAPDAKPVAPVPAGAPAAAAAGAKASASTADTVPTAPGGAAAAAPAAARPAPVASAAPHAAHATH